MKKLDSIKRGACIGAAVLLLGACGQADKADAVPSETAVESTEAQTSVQENEETTAAKEEDTDKSKEETEEKAEESEEESKEEDVKEEESEENDKEEESTDEAEESSEEHKEESEAPAPAQGNAKSVNDIYGEISQNVSLNSPMIVPDDFIMNYYGIDVNTLDEYVFSMSEAAISAETVVILKAKDAGSTSALSASLQMVIDQKRSEMENYLPDQFQIVDKSSVQVKGNYVYLVISEQADAINRIIQTDIP